MNCQVDTSRRLHSWKRKLKKKGWRRGWRGVGVTTGPAVPKTTFFKKSKKNIHVNEKTKGGRMKVVRKGTPMKGVENWGGVGGAQDEGGLGGGKKPGPATGCQHSHARWKQKPWWETVKPGEAPC